MCRALCPKWIRRRTLLVVEHGKESSSQTSRTEGTKKKAEYSSGIRELTAGGAEQDALFSAGKQRWQETQVSAIECVNAQIIEVFGAEEIEVGRL